MKTIKEPDKKDYGYHTCTAFDEEGGWLIEGGEEAYYEAHMKWLKCVSSNGQEPKVELKQYNQNGIVGDIKDIEDSPGYDGEYHKKFKEEMALREEFLKNKQITDET